MQRLARPPIVRLALAVTIIALCGAAPDTTNETELLERLSAIGYVAGSEPAEGPFGVTVHDVAVAQPGLNLMQAGSRRRRVRSGATPSQQR